MNTNIQYMHYRSANGTRGGATVAILPNDADQTATISIARCNPNDVFCKKTGREIAAGRIRAAQAGRESLESKVRVITIETPEKLKDSVATAIFDYMADCDLV